MARSSRIDLPPSVFEWSERVLGADDEVGIISQYHEVFWEGGSKRCPMFYLISFFMNTDGNHQSLPVESFSDHIFAFILYTAYPLLAYQS